MALSGRTADADALCSRRGFLTLLVDFCALSRTVSVLLRIRFLVESVWATVCLQFKSLP